MTRRCILDTASISGLDVSHPAKGGWGGKHQGSKNSSVVFCRSVSVALLAYNLSRLRQVSRADEQGCETEVEAVQGSGKSLEFVWCSRTT